MSEKVLVTNENSSLKFNGVSKIQFETNEKIFFGTYIVALPDYKRFSEFNNYFQIGMLFAIGGLLFTIIIAYHIMIGAVAGATAYVNIILTALFAIAFYFYSRD